jgi:tetratricopeptide (TPR) repeat protein/serine phosphatase RsbU (regulator of sigma subunit)
MKSIITIIALLAVTITQAQTNRNIDSLQKIFDTAKADTDRINTAIAISIEYRADGDHQNAIKYAESALVKSKATDYKTGICNAYNAIGIVHIIKSDYQSALNDFSLALDICKITGDKKMIAKLYNNTGIAYDRMNDYDNQIKCYVSSLKASEDINDTLSMAIIYENIGGVYMRGNDNDKALGYFKESLKLYQKIKNESGEGSASTSIAFIYKNKGNYKIALEIAMKSFDINKNAGDKWQMISSLSCLGETYFQIQDYDNALKNYIQALGLSKEISDESGMSNFYMEIGKIYLKKNNLDESNRNLSLAISFSQKTLNKEVLTQSYKLMSELFNKRNDCQKSYDYFLKYSALKDSLNEHEASIKIESLQSKYEADKREKILTLEKEKQEAKFEKERVIRYSFMAGFVLLFCLALLIFRGYREKKKSNIALAKKNEIITEKSKEITDNIHYAKRIQDAVMTPMSQIEELLPNNFILNKGKDIVSGDFYFSERVGNEIIVAVADCTNHGVSGAMMTLLSNNLLGDAIASGNNSPSDILNYTNKALAKKFHQTESDTKEEGDVVKDGMDIALIKIDFINMKYQFAGAYNPLIIVRDNSIIEVKADKLQMGQAKTDYKKNEGELKFGDMLYMSSDGYGDQFSGDGKKFMKKRFKELLSSVSQKSMQEQKEALESTINSWKAEAEQTDDILVMGIKI